MKTEEEIKKHIHNLKELLKDDTYADDTKMYIKHEIHILETVLNGNSEVTDEVVS